MAGEFTPETRDELIDLEASVDSLEAGQLAPEQLAKGQYVARVFEDFGKLVDAVGYVPPSTMTEPSLKTSVRREDFQE